MMVVMKEPGEVEELEDKVEVNRVNHDVGWSSRHLMQAIIHGPAQPFSISSAITVQTF